MKIINAKDLIVGRIATRVAKAALLGEEVAVLNCEKAVVTGSKQNVIAKFKRKREMGIPSKGPFLHRSPDKLLKRIIRGMIPYKQHKGRVALKRVKCYKGIPKEFEGKEIITIKEANVSKMPNLKYVKLEYVSMILGGK
ncbi:50S ribosomal protein L13 [Candidatus Woesearchaeota archaeon]|nr:50S ribosomal protein L13 [Candidatus Woesearchaeota archaeon]